MCRVSVFALTQLRAAGGGEAIEPDHPMSAPYAPCLHNQISRYCGLREALDNGKDYLLPGEARIARKAIVHHGRTEFKNTGDADMGPVIEEYRELYRKLREWLQKQ